MSNNSYLIRPSFNESGTIGARARWEPIQGPTIDAFLGQTDLCDAEREALLESSVQILAKCVPPTSANEVETGLVVGHVQSGKTMSFTGVSALAKDNGFRLVILITGISNLLQEQSKNRVARDLKMNNMVVGGWTLLVNPDVSSTHLQSFRQVIGDWQDDSLDDDERKTLFIAVMKNHKHLEKLSALLERVSSEFDLSRCPTLVIDDEADQASLNTNPGRASRRVRSAIDNAQGRRARSRMSTTYRRIRDIRRSLPSHTYLQYTATPQANLLLALADELSPNFVHLLTPGNDYAGGVDFFGPESKRGIVATIPHEDIEAADAGDYAPQSLRYAFSLFIVGMTCLWIRNRNLGKQPEPRSMLVHPSHRVSSHQVYTTWIRSIRDHWEELVSLDPSDPDRQDLVQEVQAALDDLSSTVGSDLPSVDAVLARLGPALRKTSIREVNAREGTTPLIEWSESLGHILIGGQALDRGFTVSGLIVTYMPRPTSGGNADTIQQRARFFGYKRPYLEFCRVFLSTEGRQAFESYVEHEETIRAELKSFANEYRPLDSWKRQFILVGQRPTRSNVVTLDYTRFRKLAGWSQLLPPVNATSLRDVNRLNTVVREFMSECEWVAAPDISGRTEVQSHMVASVEFDHLLEGLLIRWVCEPGVASRRLTAIQLLLRRVREAELSPPFVVKMGGPRVRQMNSGGTINIFQGATVSRDPNPYRGDRMVLKRQSDITVQIHNLEIRGTRHGSVKTFALGIYVPEDVSREVIVS